MMKKILTVICMTLTFAGSYAQNAKVSSPDGKLTVDQVVEQEHTEYHGDDIDYDEIHRGILERALEKFKEGEDRSEIIEDTVEALELF
jgi:hypothetical protein